MIITFISVSYQPYVKSIPFREIINEEKTTLHQRPSKGLKAHQNEQENLLACSRTTQIHLEGDEGTISTQIYPENIFS